MKLTPRSENQQPKSSRPKRGSIGGVRINFFPGERLLANIAALKERGRKLKTPRVYTQSNILREGAWLFIRQENALMDKAAAGSFHTKQR